MACQSHIDFHVIPDARKQQSMTLVVPPAFPSRPSRGLRPRAPLMALPSPILRRLSRPRRIALCLAPGRAGGAAAPHWVLGAW